MVSQPKGVWVWLARERGGTLSKDAQALLYEGSALARCLDAPLFALSGRAIDSQALSWLGCWGVDEVFLFPGIGQQGSAAHPYAPRGHSPFAEFSEGLRAALFPTDAFGRVAAPLLAAERNACCITCAEGIRCDREHFIIPRLVLGGQYEALTQIPIEHPVVLTVRAEAVGESEPPHAKPQKIPRLRSEPGFQGDSHPVRVLPPDASSLRITDAERIVSFGRGAFTDRAIRLVHRLAEILGAAVAGTRPAADEAWLPFERQIGLTGAIVRPKLYVAVGISGAPYHMVGVQNPETLIAINRDAEAPIFAQADLAVVGDLYATLPALIARLEQGAPASEAFAAPLPTAFP